MKLDERPIRNGSRLLDLVRFCRGDLHRAGLITDEEFAELANIGPESDRRLRNYDELMERSTKASSASLAVIKDQLIPMLEATGGDGYVRALRDLLWASGG